MLVRAQLLGGRRQRVGERLPAVRARGLAGAGDDDVLAADDLIELDGLGHAVGGNRLRAVVGRQALDAEVVEELADVLRLFGGPAVVRRVELDDLVAHLGDGADRAGQVFHEVASNRVQLDADGDLLGLGERRRRGERRRASRREERTSRKRSVDHGPDFSTSRRRGICRDNAARTTDNGVASGRSSAFISLLRGAPPPRTRVGPHPHGCQRSLRSAPVARSTLAAWIRILSRNATQIANPSSSVLSNHRRERSERWQPWGWGPTGSRGWGPANN